MRRVGPGFIVLVLVAVAIPVIILRLTQVEARSMDESLAGQANEIHQLEAENAQLSAALGDFNALKTGNGEERELLRLRNEVRQLREQTNIMERRQVARIHQEPPVGDELKDETQLSAQTLEAMRNVCRELPSAIEGFVRAHKDPPNSFSDLRAYFPLVNGRRMPGLYTFEFVRDEGARPEDLLILREQSGRETADGKRVRVYGFRDGSVVEVRREEDDFEIWEKEHFSSPP